jgi:hypothetical protein
VYCSLAVSLVSFVAVTLLSRPPLREGLMT